jgi:hypothetical protein
MTEAAKGLTRLWSNRHADDLFPIYQRLRDNAARLNTIITPIVKKEEEQELVALWTQRMERGFSQPQWTRLYELLRRLLVRVPVPQSIRDTRDDLISEYFLLRVFEPASFSASAPHHAGAICFYYANFLKDHLRRAKKGEIVDTEDEDDFERLAHADGSEDDYSDDCGCSEISVTDEAALARFRAQAKQWLTDREDWERTYIELVLCADDPEPLYKLAQRLRIASYHYKAVQLGVTTHKQMTLAEYKETTLGRWMEADLGITLAQGAQAEVDLALHALCAEATAPARMGGPRV